MRLRLLKTRGLALLLAGLACPFFVSGQEPKAPAPESLESLRGRAEKGDADVQGRLGYMYHVGQGVTQDYAEASRWYRKAAYQGLALAQYNLGLMYSKGQGVPQDYVQAYMWASLAASRASGDLQKEYADAREELGRKLTAQQITEAQSRAQDLGKLLPPPSLPVSSGGVYKVGNGVTSPTLTFKVEPEYSAEATKAKFMGTVILSIEVNEKGNVQNLRVLRSVGMGLDEKAIEAVMKWRFRPGYKDGKPVTVAAQVEVNFRIPEAKIGLSSGKETEGPRGGVDKLNPQPVPQAQRGAQDLGKLVPPPNIPLNLPNVNMAQYGAPPARIPPPSSGPGSGGGIGSGQGPGIRSDSADALIVLAEKGDPGAQHSLALRYEMGDRVLQDYAEAVQWYRKAAEQGLARAQFSLGLMYSEGKGVPEDFAEALRWWRKAAEQGEVGAQSRLGLLYGEGKGVRQDFVEAARWYRKAADQGDAPAQLGLARLYSEGKGVPKDESEALRWFVKADAQGVPIDPSEQIRWYQKIYEHADADTAARLAQRFHYGSEVPQNLSEAARWYRKAAEQGHITAQHTLGRLYAEGRGVPRDDVEAVRWYRKAAEQGDAPAQASLSFMYQEGRGVPQDNVEAHAWANLAASQGVYANLREEIAKKMTPQQITEAQGRARDLAKLLPKPSFAVSSSSVGSGRGPDFGPGQGGGFGGGAYRVGNGVTAPTLTFKVEPEYSEEARKAKFMGTVILYIEVNERGLVQNPRVLQSVGMGLDEKAVEAVMKWRFRAGYKDGKPVTVAAQVEVNFRGL